jgi:hypothetical protein
MKRVYIAGWPSGHPAPHLRRAEDALYAIAAAGLAPFAPQFYAYASGPRTTCASVYAVAVTGRRDVSWPDALVPWLRMADAVFRLDGPPAASQWECGQAALWGKPVFDDLDALLAWARNNSPNQPCSDPTGAL